MATRLAFHFHRDPEPLIVLHPDGLDFWRHWVEEFRRTQPGAEPFLFIEGENGRLYQIHWQHVAWVEIEAS